MRVAPFCTVFLVIALTAAAQPAAADPDPNQIPDHCGTASFDPCAIVHDLCDRYLTDICNIMYTVCKVPQTHQAPQDPLDPTQYYVIHNGFGIYGVSVYTGVGQQWMMFGVCTQT